MAKRKVPFFLLVMSVCVRDCKKLKVKFCPWEPVNVCCRTWFLVDDSRGLDDVINIWSQARVTHQVGRKSRGVARVSCQYTHTHTHTYWMWLCNTLMNGGSCSVTLATHSCDSLECYSNWEGASVISLNACWTLLSLDKSRKFMQKELLLPSVRFDWIAHYYVPAVQTPNSTK